MSDKTTNKGQTGHSQVSSDFLAYVLKKIEKITSASYMITNLFPPEEPLRDSLRSKSLSLLSYGCSVRYAPSQSDLLSLISLLEELSALVSVSRSAQLMSDMNAQVLRGEISNLRDEIDNEIGLAETSISSGHFQIEAPKTASQAESKSSGEGGGSEENGKKSDENTAPKKTKKSSSRRKKTKKKGRKASRRDTILEVVKDKGEISIGDVARVIQSCSQKTLQRDLLALVDQGILEKHGERRWSTYTLSNES